MTATFVVGVLIFLAALLYSSIGHSGASGYLAAMALCGVSAAVMRPTALALNILVATIATVRFGRAGCFSWSLFWPFALASIPSAFVGGAIRLPGPYYRPAVGATLLLAAVLLLRSRPPVATSSAPANAVPALVALALGTVIGLLSGLTATGGGIFLTPILLLSGWATPRQSAGVSAAFNLVNSLAAIAGRFTELSALPPSTPYWALAAGLGGLIGSEFGSRRLGSLMLRRLLAVVLVIAALKLILIS